MSWISAGLRNIGQWLRGRWGKGPRLTPEQKAALQEQLDAQKPMILALIDDEVTNAFARTISPETVEANLRAAIRKRVATLDLPAEVAFVVNRAIDSLRIGGVGTPLRELRENLYLETQRIKKQILGARL